MIPSIRIPDRLGYGAGTPRRGKVITSQKSTPRDFGERKLHLSKQDVRSTQTTPRGDIPDVVQVAPGIIHHKEPVVYRATPTPKQVIVFQNVVNRAAPTPEQLQIQRMRREAKENEAWLRQLEKLSDKRRHLLLQSLDETLHLQKDAIKIERFMRRKLRAYKIHAEKLRSKLLRQRKHAMRGNERINYLKEKLEQFETRDFMESMGITVWDRFDRESKDEKLWLSVSGKTAACKRWRRAQMVHTTQWMEPDGKACARLKINSLGQVSIGIVEEINPKDFLGQIFLGSFPARDIEGDLIVELRNRCVHYRDESGHEFYKHDLPKKCQKVTLAVGLVNARVKLV